jgi:hypothetical protein
MDTSRHGHIPVGGPYALALILQRRPWHGISASADSLAVNFGDNKVVKLNRIMFLQLANLLVQTIIDFGLDCQNDKTLYNCSFDRPLVRGRR